MIRRLTAAAALLGAVAALTLPAAPALAEMNVRFEKEVVEQVRRGERDALAAYLLSNGNPNVTGNKGEPLLVVATRADKPAMVDLLVQHGARLNDTDRQGNTALYWAADAGDAPIARALIDAGIDLDTQNRQGLTPLMAAVRGGNMEVVRALIAAGADPRLADYTGRDAFGWASGPRGPLLVNELNKAQ